MNTVLQQESNLVYCVALNMLSKFTSSTIPFVSQCSVQTSHSLCAASLNAVYTHECV
jgi:hypothetical protein